MELRAEEDTGDPCAQSAFLIPVAASMTCLRDGAIEEAIVIDTNSPRVSSIRVARPPTCLHGRDSDVERFEFAT